jgi:hypothetical protein
MAIFEKTQSIRLVKRATIAALRYANIETINKPRRDGYSSPEFYEPEIFVASGSLIAAANCLFHADNIKSMTPKAFVEAFPLPSKTLAVPFGPQEGKDRIYPFGGGYKFGDWMQSEYKKTKVAEISVREIDKNKWKPHESPHFYADSVWPDLPGNW